MAKTIKTIFLGILSLLIILLSIIQFILGINIVSKIKSKFKKRPEKYVDKIISGLKSFYFTEETSRPRYFPKEANLGLAGNLYLDCYTGSCSKNIKETEWVCDSDDDCETIVTFREQKDINEACSEECFELKGEYCNDKCSDYYDSKNGVCSRNTNDNYDNKKVCFGDNIIYFWKGKKYNFESFQTKNCTYIDNAKLKNESCPDNTKNCGILDDNENKLCLPLDTECPINFITETKLKENYNYSSTIIDNKTFYYGYDNSINNSTKIIAGLYADSDISLNIEEEEYITLDIDTLSGFLKYNYILYRGLNLDYDPYNISNIDEKGKSYLKVKYNSKNLDLVKLRKEQQQYLINKTMNEKVVGTVRKKFKSFYIMGMISYIFVILLLSNSLYYYCEGEDIICIWFFIFVLFLIFSLFGIIKSCININNFNRAKEIDILNNYDNIKTINLLYILFGFFIYGLFIVIFTTEFIINKRKALLSKVNDKAEIDFTNNNTEKVPSYIPSSSNIDQNTIQNN